METNTPKKRIAMIIAHRIFQDIEYNRPKEIFEKKGFEVVTASSDMSEAIGKYGGKVKPDILVKDINVDEFDAIVFVGGGGSEQYFHDPAAHKVAKEAKEKGKILSAICLAPNILANAGLLNGIKATCWDSDNLKEKGADYTGNLVEKVGKIITGKNPDAAIEFGNTIVDDLLKTK